VSFLGWNAAVGRKAEGPRMTRIYADERCENASARRDRWMAGKDTEDAEYAEKNISGRSPLEEEIV
jgi:hypothetical protein